MIIKYEAEPTARLFHKSRDFVRGMLGPIGCTDADTEFLTPNGWKRISEYNGEEIAQWNTDGLMEFVKPIEYVKGECDELILFKNKHAISMCLSPNHRMPLYQFDGKFVVKSADAVAKNPSRHIVPVNFVPRNTSRLLTDDEIRLRVMIAADGSYPNAGNQCIVTVRKERKKERIRKVLTANSIEWKETTHDSRPTEVLFTFKRPLFPKPLNESFNWYMATREELAILLDEVTYWDGLFNHEELRFTTAKIEEANIVQYAAHCCGRVSHINVVKYKNDNWNDIYSVTWSKENSPKGKIALRGDGVQIERVQPVDGKQYCFVVPSSFWIARRDKRIFVTGNSGKSVACIMEILSKALEMPPGTDGIRRSRWACIRNTYPELKSTLIKSWQDWFPENVCPIRWDVPITGTIKIADLGDGTGLDFEAVFLAIDKPQDVKKLLSIEFTGVWLNEAKELDKSVLDMATGRVGRYPGKKSLPPNVKPWSGVIMDTNPMDEDHWYYKLAEENRPVGYRFFRQPGAVVYRDGKYYPNPAAENIKNHTNGFDYYMRQIPGKQHEWIKVYVMGEYGCVIDGRPVYPEYTDTVHCASEVDLTPIKGVPLMLGWDFGLTPCCIIGQLTPRGKLLIIDEITSDGMGIRQFANDVVIPYLSSHYKDFDFHSVADPAGVQRGQNNEATCLQELATAGIPTDPAWTNDPTARREAVAGFLNKMSDGQPAFVLSPKCKMLRKGFLGGYQFRRMQTSAGKFADKPEKNEYSHPHDALQYLALALEEKKSRADKAKARSANRKSAGQSLYSPADNCAGY